MSQNGYEPMDELTLNSLWNERVRPTGKPVTGSDRLDPAMTTVIDRMNDYGNAAPPASSRERVRDAVRANLQTTNDPQKEPSMFATPALERANAPVIPERSPTHTGPRVGPRLRLPAHSRRWIMAQAAGALLLLAALMAGILLLNGQRDDGHPAVAPASPPATPASSWLQYRNGPAHLGVATKPGPSEPPIERWSVSTRGAINSEPAIDDGVLYIGSEDGHLYALDTGTGEQKWAFDAGSAVDTSPAIGNGLVYATDRNEILHAIELATGESAWTFASANPNAAATLAEGVLYVAGNDTSLYALDPATSATLWSFDTGGNTGRTPAFANGVVYLGNENGQLFAVDATTGAQRWVFAGASGTAGSTVIDGTTVYQSYIHGADDRLYALDAATGAELWSFGTPAKDTVWVPAVAGDTLYAPSNDGNIYALDTRTGAIRWQFAAAGPAESSGVLDDSTFYVADDTGYLYALDRVTGAERWRIPVDDGATKGPALVDGVLYLGTMLGTVHAFADPGPNVIGAPDMATPAAATPAGQPDRADLIWSLDAASGAFQTPGGLSVDPSGRLWVFDGANTIFILDESGNVVDTWKGDFNFTQGDGDVYGDAVFADNGDIYLLDAGTYRILKFDAQRNLLTSWGGFGNGDGQFRSLVALAIAPNGNILVADDAQDRIQEFDPDGTFIASWETGGDIADLVVASNGNVYSGSGCDVVVWDATGKELDRWAASDSPNCPYLSGLELDPEGRLFVTVAIRPYDEQAANVVVFDEDGNLVTQWNPRLDPANNADFDDAFVLDGQGNLYVLDYFTDTIAKLALRAPLAPGTPAAG